MSKKIIAVNVIITKLVIIILKRLQYVKKYQYSVLFICTENSLFLENQFTADKYK